MKKVFAGYGLEIFVNNGKYYLRADFGEIVDRIRDVEITNEEAEKIQRSSKDANEVMYILDENNRIPI